MPSPYASPYQAPEFYTRALAQGRHRDIVGGRWEETGRLQMALLQEAGLTPDSRLLDIGAGSLRLGCKAVPYLRPGHYWGTDPSRALMLRGRQAELDRPDALPEDHLIEDAGFAFPGVPETITHAIAFAVFTHLPMNDMARALVSVGQRFPRLEAFLLTVFLAPDAGAALGPLRQPDGVVTHDTRAPYHLLRADVAHFAQRAGFCIDWRPDRLPRGQVLAVLRRESPADR